MKDIYGFNQSDSTTEGEPMTDILRFLSSYGSERESSEVSPKDVNNLLREFDSTMSRLTIDPLTNTRDVYNTSNLQSVKNRAREIANTYINRNPKATQYIESNYQRWVDSIDKQIDDNSRMFIIKKQLEELHSDGGKIDDLESTFKGLNESDMSMPYIKTGKDGKISRSEAFSKIAEVTNYLKNNREFILDRKDHPYFNDIANNIDDANALASFYTSQLISRNESSDKSILSEKELEALNNYRINGDSTELMNMAKEAYTQADLFEQNIKSSIESSLNTYLKNNEFLDKSGEAAKFDEDNYDTPEEAIEAKKNILISTSDDTESGEGMSLYDFEATQDRLVKRINSLNKEHSMYDIDGTSFFDTPDAIKYRGLLKGQSSPFNSSTKGFSIPNKVKKQDNKNIIDETNNLEDKNDKPSGVIDPLEVETLPIEGEDLNANDIVQEVFNEVENPVDPRNPGSSMKSVTWTTSKKTQDIIRENYGRKALGMLNKLYQLKKKFGEDSNQYKKEFEGFEKYLEKQNKKKQPKALPSPTDEQMNKLLKGIETYNKRYGQG